MGDMIDFRQWLYSTTNRRITAEQIGEILGISRTSATRRLTKGDLSAGEVIALCRKVDVNPVLALVDLEYISDPEVWDYLESEGKLVETAEDGELALELARRLNPAKIAPILDELAARRKGAHS